MGKIYTSLRLPEDMRAEAEKSGNVTQWILDGLTGKREIHISSSVGSKVDMAGKGGSLDSTLNTGQPPTLSLSPGQSSITVPEASASQKLSDEKPPTFTGGPPAPVKPPEAPGPKEEIQVEDEEPRHGVETWMKYCPECAQKGNLVLNEYFNPLLKALYCEDCGEIEAHLDPDQSKPDYEKGLKDIASCPRCGSTHATFDVHKVKG